MPLLACLLARYALAECLRIRTVEACLPWTQILPLGGAVQAAPATRPCAAVGCAPASPELYCLDASHHMSSMHMVEPSVLLGW